VRRGDYDCADRRGLCGNRGERPPAFNDPPADFDTEEPFIVVELAERGPAATGTRRVVRFVGGKCRGLRSPCRFDQILKARAILCLVSGARKAEAMKLCLEGDIGPDGAGVRTQAAPERDGVSGSRSRRAVTERLIPVAKPDFDAGSGERGLKCLGV